MQPRVATSTSTSTATPTPSESAEEPPRLHLMLKLYARTSAGLLFLFTNCREHKMHFVISWRAPSVRCCLRLGPVLTSPHLSTLFPWLCSAIRSLFFVARQSASWLAQNEHFIMFLKFNSHDEAHQRARPDRVLPCPTLKSSGRVPQGHGAGQRG